MRKRIIIFCVSLAITSFNLFGCSSTDNIENKDNASTSIMENDKDNSSQNSDLSDEDIGISVNYSKKECISLTKDDLSNYNNEINLNNKSITIDKPGEYVLQGEIYDGQIIVDVSETEEKPVILILNGVNVNCNNSSAFVAKNADKVIISLVEGTTNSFTDGENYSDSSESSPNACIYSKTDLAIAGNGELNVTGNFNNGIVSKDDLTITGGNINVKAVKNGIKGKDSIAIKTATININAGNDGLKTDNNEDEDKGFILIDYGDIEIVAGDDGIHADKKIVINNGNININQSYEGIEAEAIVVNDGKIHVVSSDDGFNAASNESNMADYTRTEENKDNTIGDGNKENVGQRKMGGFGSSSGKLIINGGYIYINAKGDGIDSNGTMKITGGYIVVDGPANGGNGAFDYDSTCEMTGGFVVASGYSQMAQMPNSGTVNSVMIGFDSVIQPGTFVGITDSNDNLLIAYTSSKSYNNLVVCSENFKANETYNIYTGGKVSGEVVDGIGNGIYTDGTKFADFQIQNTTTTVGNAAGMGGFGGTGGQVGPGGQGGPDGQGGMGGHGVMNRPGQDGNNMPEGMEFPDGKDFPEGMERPEGGKWQNRKNTENESFDTEKIY